MFDIGFSELVVIGLVALIVIGPERLPRVARTLGHLLGRMQRYVNDVKSDITREMELEELKRLQKSVEDSARAIEQTVTTQMSAAESELKQASEAVEQSVSELETTTSPRPLPPTAPAAVEAPAGAGSPAATVSPPAQPAQPDNKAA